MNALLSSESGCVRRMIASIFTTLAISLPVHAATFTNSTAITTLVSFSDPEIPHVYTAPGDPFSDPVYSGSLPAGLTFATSTSIWYGLSMNSMISVEDGGSGVSNAGVTGGFPGSGAWNRPVAAQVGDYSAVLTKVSNGSGGGPYLSGGSIYYGGMSDALDYAGGVLSVTDETPVFGLQEIAFQIQIGEAWGYDFHNRVLPLLNYTTASGSFTSVPANSYDSDRLYNGMVWMPPGQFEEVYINLYELRWDLSGVEDEILSFDIQFEGVQHAQLYGLRLDQFGAIPEPSAVLLGAFGSLILFLRRRH